MTRLAALILMVLALTSVTPSAQEQERLLKAAMNTELVNGDLKAAIEQYRKVAAGGNRTLAAQALLRMAECYEKLGDPAFRKIYERLVREYADQKEAVAVASAALRRIEGVAPAAMASRRLWTTPSDSQLGDRGSAISLEERFLTYRDTTRRSDLVVHDFAAGRDRPLSNRPNAVVNVDYVLGSAISRDGRQVAFTLVRIGVNRGELRLAALDGTGVPQSRLLFANEDVEWLAPLDWSPDGNWIAVQVDRPDRTRQLGLISVRTGALSVLKSSEWRGASQLFFSPDGRYLGFDLPAGETASGQRDVFVLAMDGSREIPAVVGASDDTMMGWSPDGKYLLFASDRKGAVGLWGLPIADGKPQGPAQLTNRTCRGFLSA